MPIFTVGAAGTTSSSYEVDNSLRFNNPSDDTLTRTQTAGNRKIYTFSVWIKRAKLGAYLNIMGTNSEGEALRIENSNALAFFLRGSANGYLVSNDLFRDTAAWYHIVVAVDTSQATASNRVKIYVNNRQITSFSSETYPSLNAEEKINQNGETFYVGNGHAENSSREFDGYMAEAVMIDGQQLTPTSFGEVDSNTGIWKPIDVSDLTFGTNGFYLDFENSSSLGADVSGNGNNFTVNNLTSVDQSLDTPTNNYCVLNILTSRGGGTITEGNLKYTASGSDSSIFGTLPIPAGMKVYFEVKLVNNTAQNAIGIFNEYDPGGVFKKGGDGAGTYSYKVRGAASFTQYFNNGSATTTSISNYSNDTIIGVAVDNENGQIHYHVNGTYLNSSDPTDNNPAALVTGFGGSNEQYLHFSLDTTTSQPINEYNFGSPPYTISSSNSDANGHGNFEYAVPSGYYALNSKNLAQFG